MTPTPDISRRPIKTRGRAWAGALASTLARKGLTPDAISSLGIGFAVLGAASIASTLVLDSPAALACALLAGGVFIQLRLLANMLDGLVAVEGGLGGPLGGLYNELPDRLEDVVLIVTTGYAATTSGWPHAEALGWGACVLALLVPYVRALAGDIGAGHPFHGPMAKPHRMFLLTCGCLVGAALVPAGLSGHVLYTTLAVMVIGMVVTLVRRIRAAASTLREAGGA